MLKQISDMEAEKSINITDSGEMAEKEELLHDKNHPRGGLRTLPFILGTSFFFISQLHSS